MIAGSWASPPYLEIVIPGPNLQILSSGNTGQASSAIFGTSHSFAAVHGGAVDILEASVVSKGHLVAQK